MKKTVLLLIAFVAYFFISCGSSKKDEVHLTKLKLGTYAYVLSDSSGNELASGNIKIDAISPDRTYKNPDKFSGTYTVAFKDSTTTFPGSETLRDGEFYGMYNRALATTSFDMNPKVADANIFISATNYQDSLVGGWSFSTMRGSKQGGLFKAKKIK
ncbi:MAG TPA: hypothetical protein VGK25_06050 [Ignavibacteria bacterium]|jgi:hypothetical protein